MPEKPKAWPCAYRKESLENEVKGHGTCDQQRRRKKEVNQHYTGWYASLHPNPPNNILKEDTKTDQTGCFKSIHTEPASLEVRSSNEKKKWQISVRILGVSWDMTFKF